MTHAAPFEWEKPKRCRVCVCVCSLCTGIRLPAGSRVTSAWAQGRRQEKQSCSEKMTGRDIKETKERARGAEADVFANTKAVNGLLNNKKKNVLQEKRRARGGKKLKFREREENFLVWRQQGVEQGWANSSTGGPRVQTQ